MAAQCHTEAEEELEGAQDSDGGRLSGGGEEGEGSDRRVERKSPVMAEPYLRSP